MENKRCTLATMRLAGHVFLWHDIELSVSQQSTAEREFKYDTITTNMQTCIYVSHAAGNV